MTVKQAISVLKKHNNWRRGGYSHPQDPKTIGEAIDVDIVMLESASKRFPTLNRLSINTNRYD